MRYIQRTDGVIVSDYRWPQTALAEERIEEGDPEFLAYRNPPPPLPENTPTTIDDLVVMLKSLNLPGASAAQIDAALVLVKQNRP